MSLGIQVSISKMREWERFLENTDSESDAPFRPRMPLMANPRALGECIRKANALSLPTLRNLLTCSGMASQKGALQSRLPRWHCRICGSVSVLWHTGEVCATRKRFRIARSESVARRGQAELRAIPSLRIRCWRVDRFIPRRAAAPFRPATTQLHCSSAFRIC